MPLLVQVAEAVSAAIARARPELAGADPVVRRSEHADFQSNAAPALAKSARSKPAELAEAVTTALGDLTDGTVAKVELSGPGL